jgi:hypothetical protein
MWNELSEKLNVLDPTNLCARYGLHLVATLSTDCLA